MSIISRLDRYENASLKGATLMASNISNMTWNVNGLLQYKESLIVTIFDRKIDGCLISETHFTRESYIVLRGFDLYHTMHPNICARGGSAVIIKNEISPHEDVKIEEEEFQVNIS
jgi:hypothetical protein